MHLPVEVIRNKHHLCDVSNLEGKVQGAVRSFLKGYPKLTTLGLIRVRILWAQAKHHGRCLLKVAPGHNIEKCHAKEGVPVLIHGQGSPLLFGVMTIDSVSSSEVKTIIQQGPYL